MPPGQTPAADFFTDTEIVGREDHLRLHLNENPYGPPPGTVDAVHEEAARHLHRYPDSECALLRAGLAAHFGVGQDMIAVGNGTDEIVLLASLAFLRSPGASVVTTAGTFPGYVTSAASVGARARTVELVDAAVPVDRMRAEMERGAGLAFVCNPLNPTGAVLDRGAVRELVGTAERTGTVLVFDEAYMDFAGPAYEFALDAVRAGRRILVTRTFSKAWGLAALRLGVALGPRDLVGRLAAVARALPFRANRAAQSAVLRALQHPEYVERVRADTVRARELLCKHLDALGLAHTPSAANFVMVRVPGEGGRGGAPGDSARLVARLAAEHRVHVRNLDGLGLPGYVRISVGTAAQTERLATALGACLDDLPAQH